MAGLESARMMPPIGEVPLSLPTTKADKDSALAATMQALRKKHKDEGIVMSLGSRVGVPMPHIPTGIAELDHVVLGIGGLPKGRITEFYGPESGGKTTLALTSIAEAQKLGGNVAFVDAEHALDPNWAKLLGVDVNNLVINQPDYGEQAYDVAEELILSGGLDMLVLDSVAALVPLTELEGGMEDAQMGLAARMNSKAMRKLAPAVSKTGTVVILINQIREKLGVMFGNPETTPGGRAVKHAASVRLHVRRTGQLGKEGSEAVRNNVKITANKNKVSAPFRECDVDLIYGSGFDRLGSLVKLAKERDVITGSTWLSFNGNKIANGIDKTIEVIRNDQELYKLIQQKLAKPFAAKESI